MPQSDETCESFELVKFMFYFRMYFGLPIYRWAGENIHDQINLGGRKTLIERTSYSCLFPCKAQHCQD